MEIASRSGAGSEDDDGIVLLVVLSEAVLSMTVIGIWIVRKPAVAVEVVVR